ncbi:pseudouridine synthase [Paenibacillus sp. J31TS4]|uniref:RluA family pseudouridine synthase n=1 Tax=Paenibacillus sp. J31TS4 TaxID=2807195 RepID=UPI001B2C0ABD|nr:RluA family pseudouridine synthase [Paenibacillus sp. J31TS4]GIP38898.1 pseudouridine synthase [Paenibacillus sp. J31TS4]
MQKKPKPSRPSPPGPRAYPVREADELLRYLLKTLAGQGRNSIKAMLARGQIHVDGQAVTAYNYSLQPGQTVTVHKEKPPEAPPLVGLSILYEDEHLLVVDKDAGLLSIATEQEKEWTAYRQLMEHVRAQKPEARVFIVHRLDRDTSGVMMFAKSEEVQQRLQTHWRDLVKERTYVALVEGAVRKPEGTIASWLKESKTLKMYSSPYPNDGQHAVTHYRTLRTGNGYSLLEVNLETGRKNQIRVHMQDIGHPIAGDKKYGARLRDLHRLGLHAKVLAFEHPMDGRMMRFEAEVPKALLRPFAGKGKA